MNQLPMSPDARYAQLVETLLCHAGVTQSGKGFGSTALKLHRKIFAMLVRGHLVVKLPKARVDALVAAGSGERYDPRHDGRLMKEWLVIAPSSEDQWLALATEAKAFAAA